MPSIPTTDIVFDILHSFTENRNRKDSSLKDALKSSFKASREKDRAYMEQERNHIREEMGLRQDEAGTMYILHI